MRQPPSRTTTTRKRAKRQPTRDAVWRIVETPLTPMLTPEQIAAANAADLAKQQRAPRRPRPPQQLTVGYGYYPLVANAYPLSACEVVGWSNWALPLAANSISACAMAS